MIQRCIRIFAFLFSLSLLTLTLTLAWEFPTVAQMVPGLGWSKEDIAPESYIPVFPKGNLEVAPVFLDGKLIGTIPSFIEVGLRENANVYSASVRSQLIHSKLQKVLNNIIRYSQQVFPKQGIFSLEAQEKELREQLITEVSVNKGMVVVLETFPREDVPEVIYSVTQADVELPRLVSSQPIKIAQRAAVQLEDLLIQAWKERQTPHLLLQAKQALRILILLMATSLVLLWIQKRLTVRHKQLGDRISDSENLQLEKSQTSDSSKVTKGLGLMALQLYNLSLRQRHSLNAFYRSGLFWTQWLLWMLGIGYLAGLFHWTRPLSNWMIGVSIRGYQSGEAIAIGWPPTDWLLSFGTQANLGTPLFILLLLLVTRLILKGGDAISDILARQWSEQKSIKRHSLRAPTLSKALKSWLRVIVYLLLGLTVAYHLHQLGRITQFIAVILGFLSFAVSLASQNLLKDLIGGLLILWEDQYAVGDVIVINSQSGLVEKITLRVTQLRNLDGELITIPNGSVGMVQNLSSEWSRVNYAVEVNYDTDVDRVMEIMAEVAQQMYRDPQWQDLILETPEMLGVDRIAHTGILIRLLIKTQPLQQWRVGREFRYRLKKVFDEQGIVVGIPQHRMYLDQSFHNHNNGNFKMDNQHQN
ncbi:MAG: mechanosensitive ion channel family protein [Cyanobacteria bacterium J06592_8]